MKLWILILKLILNDEILKNKIKKIRKKKSIRVNWPNSWPRLLDHDNLIESQPKWIIKSNSFLIPMLKDKIKKIKKNEIIGLTHQVSDPGHETELTL